MTAQNSQTLTHTTAFERFSAAHLPAQGQETTGHTRHLAEILTDFSCAGRIRFTAREQAVRLEHSDPVQTAKQFQSTALAAGSRFSLRFSLPACKTLHTLNRKAGFSLHDVGGRPVIDFTAMDDVSRFAFRAMRTAYGLRPHPSEHGRWLESAQSIRLPRHMQEPKGFGTLPQDADGSGGCPRFESFDRSMPHAHRLRDEGRASAIDPDLIPPFLDAMVDQAVAIQVLTGGQALAHRFHDPFYDLRRHDGWMELTGHDARFSIHTPSVVGAWIVTEDSPAGGFSQLRLYDATGRSLAILQAKPNQRGPENPIWRVLVKALRD